MTSKALILLLAVCALVTTVVSHQYTGYDFGAGISRLNRRRSITQSALVFNQLASVTEDDDDNKALRKEIRDLEQNEDQWTLYILGLSMMQYTNQSDEISWYQVTGLLSPSHGCSALIALFV
jgi:tyrosinase